jgi:hypothetical protein
MSEVDQIIGFTIVSGSISPRYGDGANDGTLAGQNERRDQRRHKNRSRRKVAERKAEREGLKEMMEEMMNVKLKEMREDDWWESTHRCWYYSFSYYRNNSDKNFKRTDIFTTGRGIRKMLCLIVFILVRHTS